MIIPSLTKLVPAKPEFIPSHQELSPANRKSVPSHPEFVPSYLIFVPSHQESFPSQLEFVPSHPEFAPSYKKIAPSDREFISVTHNLSEKLSFIQLSGRIAGTDYHSTGQNSPARDFNNVFSTVHESKHKFRLRNYVAGQYKSIP